MKLLCLLGFHKWVVAKEDIGNNGNILTVVFCSVCGKQKGSNKRLKKVRL